MKTKLLLFMTVLAGFFSNAQTVHLTGAGVGGWNNPPLSINQMTSADNVNYSLSNVQITGSGGSAEFKFMVNSDWGTTYGFTSLTGTPGANAWQSGVAGAGGGNIGGVAGFWNVAYNLTTGVYSFTPGVNPNAVINLTSSAAPISMVTSNGTDYTSPSTTLSAGTFLFTQAGSPNQWGNPAFPSGTATQGGSGVVVPAGTYNITFNKSTGAYAFANTSVGMIGVGSPSGSWGVDAVMTTTDAVIYRINNAVINGGSMKFRDNNSWTYEFGCNGPANSNAFPSGTAIANGTDMLTVSGTYNITFNRTTKEYNFVATTFANNTFDKSSFKVSPNPTNNVWKIGSSEIEIKSVQVVDVLGKVVYTNNTAANELNIDATSFTNGLYFARIASDNGNETIKLVKN